MLLEGEKKHLPLNLPACSSRKMASVSLPPCKSCMNASNWENLISIQNSREFERHILWSTGKKVEKVGNNRRLLSNVTQWLQRSQSHWSTFFSLVKWGQIMILIMGLWWGFKKTINIILSQFWSLKFPASSIAVGKTDVILIIIHFYVTWALLGSSLDVLKFHNDVSKSGHFHCLFGLFIWTFKYFSSGKFYCILIQLPLLSSVFF